MCRNVAYLTTLRRDFQHKRTGVTYLPNTVSDEADVTTLANAMQTTKPHLYRQPKFSHLACLK